MEALILNFKTLLTNKGHYVTQLPYMLMCILYANSHAGFECKHHGSKSGVANNAKRTLAFSTRSANTLVAFAVSQQRSATRVAAAIAAG